MDENDVSLFLENFGAMRFFIAKNDKVVYIERREAARVFYTDLLEGEWIDFLKQLRRFGWMVIEREYIPALMGG
ncbi:MAG: hypothetical protein KGJ89_05515 [Patescibacteria group bacterium]|nr:hypothetical protein [Patescibacteria group bacterium]MDE2227380.1 hypothetical protein [Patescibacteria group bacterium]